MTLSCSQDENEEEEDLLDHLSSALTSILREFQDSCMPFIDSIMPQIGQLLDQSRSPAERRIGICIIDDLLEHSGAGAALLLFHEQTRPHQYQRICPKISPACYHPLQPLTCSGNARMEVMQESHLPTQR